MSVELIHGDCMDYMRGLPDNAFELAIVDPPYGIGLASNSFRGKQKKKSWDENIPSKKYFDELMRVSCNQIIWGGNYFDLPPSKGFLIWDKIQPFDFTSSMCEMAWMSIQRPAKMFRLHVVTAEKEKIHPTQKPVKLYEWILAKFSEPGDRILDTHLGSGSSAIAAHYSGHDFVGIELDADYYEAAKKRFNQATKQIDIFAVEPL
jgi:site-specific DNA-methyltransferase (adenine-specific)